MRGSCNCFHNLKPFLYAKREAFFPNDFTHVLGLPCQKIEVLNLSLTSFTVIFSSVWKREAACLVKESDVNPLFTRALASF